MVQPQNIGSAVEEFLSLLHLNPHQEFVLEQNDPGILLVIYIYFSNPSPSSHTCEKFTENNNKHIIICYYFLWIFMCRLPILQTNTNPFNFLSSSHGRCPSPLLPPLPLHHISPCISLPGHPVSPPTFILCLPLPLHNQWPGERETGRVHQPWGTGGRSQYTYIATSVRVLSVNGWSVAALTL